MKANIYNKPWLHWIVDDFLDQDTLAEVKSVEHTVEQAKPGKRVDSVRLFITDEHEKQFPNLHHLYRSLRNGAYKTFFEYYTGIDYTGMFPRVEVISDIGDFWLTTGVFSLWLVSIVCMTIRWYTFQQFGVVYKLTTGPTRFRAKNYLRVFLDTESNQLDY